MRWLKVNFSECFCAWVHIKALRVFVESVLRYVPINYKKYNLNKAVKHVSRHVYSQKYMFRPFCRTTTEH